MNNKITAKELKELIGDIARKRYGLAKKFIRERGWKKSCQHHCGTWRYWTKEIKNKIYVAPIEVALDIETYEEFNDK